MNMEITHLDREYRPAESALHYVDNLVNKWIKTKEDRYLNKAHKRVMIYKDIKLNLNRIEQVMLNDYFQVILAYLSAVQIGDIDLIEERAKQLIKFYENV